MGEKKCIPMLALSHRFPALTGSLTGRCDRKSTGCVCVCGVGVGEHIFSLPEGWVFQRQTHKFVIIYWALDCGQTYTILNIKWKMFYDKADDWFCQTLHIFKLLWGSNLPLFNCNFITVCVPTPRLCILFWTSTPSSPLSGTTSVTHSLSGTRTEL